MKAYGRQRGDELEYPELGAPSKHRKMTSKHRKTTRRALHQRARRQAKQEIKNQD